MSATSLPVSFDDVRAAAARIAGRVHRTPVVTSRQLDELAGAQLFCKSENLQKVGAFKARGATNAVLSLSDTDAARGVCTHSSGNHAAALAFAARTRGIPCHVVMPENAPAVKVTAVRSYGAEIVFCKQTEREATCARVAAETGATVIHPFEDLRVIAGQGTVLLELLEQVPDLDAVLVPVGGGGLLAGSAVTARALRPELELIGAEPDAVDDAARSLQTGVRQPRVDDPDTACDGLLTALGEPNFGILSALQVPVRTAAESTILRAAQLHLERTKHVVEPSGAVPLAVVLDHREHFAGRRVGLVLTGGNTDFSWLCRLRTSCPR